MDFLQWKIPENFSWANNMYNTSNRFKKKYMYRMYNDMIVSIFYLEF